MANSKVNLADEERLKFGCQIINKCVKLGLVAGDVTGRATLAALLAQIEVRKLALGINMADRFVFDALKREVSWLQELGFLTNGVIAALTTVNTANAATDLRFNFSTLVATDPNFDATRNEYVEFASGSTVY